MPLDRSRPFCENWGAGLIGYTQDGQDYNLAGELIGGEARSVPEPAPPTSRSEKMKAAWAKRKATQAEPESTSFAAMSDEELRAQVEIRGDEWTDRKAALALLEGEDAI